MNREHVIIVLLVVLNILIRYPIVPHELGHDSLFIHTLANSIVEHGEARWVLHPLSLFGIYPLSYPSGVPYLLAISSLITGLDMEGNIYLVSLLFGMIGMFAAFIVGGEFNDNFYFKSLTAFIFSLSPIALKFTLWNVSTRGMLLMILPLFVWCLVRMHKNYQHRYLLLSAIFLISLASAHRMAFLTSLIVVACLLAGLLPRITKKISTRYSPYLLIFLFLFLFSIQFFFVKNWWAQTYTIRLLEIHSTRWYYFLFGTIFTMMARYGFLIPLAIIGLVVLLFRRDKSFAERFLIITMLLVTPLLGHTMYFYQILLPFFSLLSAIGIIYFAKFFDRVINQKYVAVFMLIALICFSLFTLFYRYTNVDEHGNKNYVPESLYSLANFIQNETDNRMIEGYSVTRLIIPFITNPTSASTEMDYLIRGLVDVESLRIERRSFYRIWSLRAVYEFVQRPYKRRTFVESVSKSVPTPHYVIEGRRTPHHIEGDDRVYDNGVDVVWGLEESLN